MSGDIALDTIRNPRFKEFIKQAIIKAEAGNFSDLKYAQQLREFPVNITEFIDSKKYMNNAGTIYSTIYPELEELNNGEYQEAVLTGAIGTGKTTIALYTIAYQLYLLSCMKNPHKVFELDPNSEIEFIFQSINSDLAKEVDFARFKSMIENSVFFQTRFMFDKTVLSALKFPNRIIVKPISGSEMGSLGQNVIGGVIDELNFMAITENSKQSTDGGVYDQAVELYNSIARRRKSRFMVRGKMPGILCLVSSKRFPGQFTDIKEEEARTELSETGKTGIYVYDKKVWDVKPNNFIDSVWFKVFIGDLTRKPFIIDMDNRKISKKDKHLVVLIPNEYRHDFRQDILKALRDIAGVSTLATAPFIMNVEAIDRAFKKKAKSIFSRNQVDFKISQLGVVKSAIKNPNFPRFVHIDLGLTADAAGFAIGHVPKFVNMKYEESIIQMPYIVIDGTLRITPPLNGEINFEKIRKIIYKLVQMGINVRWVTFDSYQSVDSIQILQGGGFITGNQSMDRTTIPYDVTKTALLEDRLSIPKHSRLQMEVLRLERTVKGKIDHPPNFGKDIADALAGVTYGLTMQRFIWVSFGIEPNIIVLPQMNKDSKEAA